MSSDRWHPEEFGPYLDRDTSDPAYERILEHLAGCESCRQEAAHWESMDSLFRTPELELEVPPQQWQRIASRLHYRRPAAAWKDAVQSLFGRPRIALWNSALAAAVIILIVVAGLEYRRYESNQEIIAEIQMTGSGTIQPHPGANPFQIYLESSTEVNPFEEYNVSENYNPFRARP